MTVAKGRPPKHPPASGDGNSGATAQESAAATTTSTTGTAPSAPTPVDSTLVPSDVPVYGYIYDVKSGRLIEVPAATEAGRV